MATIAEALALALEHHQAGNLPQAEQLYRQILQLDAGHAPSLHLLGVLAQQRGQHQEALGYIRQAIVLHPEDSSFHSNLGLVYQSLRQPEEAIACFRTALRLWPEYYEAHYNLGIALGEQGQLDEAAASYRAALRLRPDSPEVHNNLGNVLRQQGRLDEAAACFRHALQLRPHYADAFNNLGVAFQDQRPLEEAVECYRQAVRLQADFIEAHTNLGLALREQGQLAEAVACFRQALHFQPNLPGIHYNLGNALRDLGNLDEAVAHFRQALRWQPDYVQAHNNLGLALLTQGHLEAARASFRQALHLRPDFAEAHNNLGGVLATEGKLEEAERHLQEACRLKPEDPGMHSSLLMFLNYAPRSTPLTLLAEHRRWAERHGRASAPAHPNDPDPGRRLRVGYVSPDFRQHPVAAFLRPILAHHDPRQVEVFCYAEVPVPDETTACLRALAHAWRPTHGLSDDQVAARIRADGIDLLVDLAGHTAAHRLLVFARKPAPIQLTYLGYPSTTGLSAIDYRLTDAVADPPGEPASNTEELWRLPGCFCCFAPPAGAPDVADLPALRAGQVTFGSLHNLAKLNDQVLDLWCRLLQAIPSARLLVCRGTLTGETRARLRKDFDQRGIAAERVELRPGTLARPEDYLKVYAEVDVLLDPFPWGGHTTACEALWMGVPVLTLSGDRHAGRMVSSLLHCLDLAEWVARSREDYIERGVRLTLDLAGLAGLRQSLRERMRASPLCDGVAFTRRLEEAYRAMWQRWCAARVT